MKIAFEKYVFGAFAAFYMAALAVKANGLAAEFDAACEAGAVRREIWATAWRRAGEVESVIDATRAKIALGEQAVRAGLTKELEKRAQGEDEVSTKGRLLAFAAVSAAFDGQTEAAKDLLEMARAQLKAVDEWKGVFARRDLAKAEAIMLLMSGERDKPQVELLRGWVEALPAERGHGAAWACCEWVARSAGKDNIEASKAVSQAAFEYGTWLSPVEQSYLAARMAKRLAECGLRHDISVAVSALVKIDDIGRLPDDRFAVIVNAARGASGIGDRARFEELIKEARERAEAGRHVGATAPWALLAEAQHAAGDACGSVRQTLLKGLERAEAMPGYHRTVAQALTLGAMATMRCEWSQEDLRRIKSVLSGKSN